MNGSDASPLFSVCTLITDRAQYAAMRASFETHGFVASTAEFLHVDNSAGNNCDAFAGLRHLLDEAKGRYVILCHQDVRLLSDGASILAERLAELSALAPDWAVAGNAGAVEDGSLRIRISDPHGEDQSLGPFPVQVESLDENFLVVRREAGLRPSAELNGFHLYGTDLCLQARRAGRTAWVVDFHLRHLSPGTVDAGFETSQARFERHWGELLRQRLVIHTTCTRLQLRVGMVDRMKGRLLVLHRRLGL